MPSKDLLFSFAPLILAFVFIYFFMIKPQKKREKEVAEMRNGIQVGNEVLTVGGIKGTVTKSGEDYITIKSGNTEIEFTRNAVYRVLSNEESSK